MTRRREERPIAKHTLNLYEGDYDWLRNHYGSRVGAARIIRDVIHAHILKVRAAAAPHIPTLDELDVEFEA